MISLQKLRNYPDSPGVYVFKNNLGKTLYIGKATSLRNRVKSYFATNIRETRGQLIETMIGLAKKLISFKLIRFWKRCFEANLIRKYKPHYNTREKDDKVLIP